MLELIGLVGLLVIGFGLIKAFADAHKGGYALPMYFQLLGLGLMITGGIQRNGGIIALGGAVGIGALVDWKAWGKIIFRRKQ